MPFNILFLGDSPDLPSGLARITRSLAVRLASHPAFRVGYLGLGGTGAGQWPFQVFGIPTTQGIRGEWWGTTCLDCVWGDFAGSTPGAVFAVWDLERTAYIGTEKTPQLRAAMAAGRVQLWGYHPIDGSGPAGKLWPAHAAAACRCHRVVAYTQFSARLLAQARGEATENIPVLSHGVEGAVFRPLPLSTVPVGRLRGWMADPQRRILGVVMTNQARKDWGLVARAASELPATWHLWCHTDALEGPGWDLLPLWEAYGLAQRTQWTLSLTDHELAALYSHCDVILDAAPEGWGFPQAEARMCGSPSLGLSLAAGLEVASSTVPVLETRLEGLAGTERPVLRPAVVAAAIEQSSVTNRDQIRLEALERFSWERVWPRWQTWFEQGLPCA